MKSRVAWRISCIYAGFGEAWIFLSSALVWWDVGEPPNLASFLEMGKGSVFILVTAALLFILLRRWEGEINRRDEDLRSNNRAIAELNGRLNAIMRCSQDLIAAWDKQKRLIAVNPLYASVCETFFGVSAAPGMSIETLFAAAPEMLRHFSACWDRALKGDSFVELQHLDGPDGGGWFETSYGCLTGTDGEVIGGFHIVRDVTKRRQAEEGLRFTQFVIDKASYQALWLREDGRIFYANDAACTALGYTRDELLKMSISDIDPAFTREAFAKSWIELKSRGSITLESCVYTKDGQAIPVEVCANYIRSDDTECACSVITDISRRKLAEDALRASETRYRAFVDNATDDFFVYDSSLTVVDANRHACESLGYNHEELIGMHLRDFHVDQEGKLSECIVEQLASDDTVTVQCLHRRKDGTVYPAESRCSVFQQGGQRFRLCLSRDLTERKRAEQRLNAQHSVNQVLAEAATVAEAAPKILESVCRHLGWDLGTLWRIDQEAGVLRCVEIWCDSSLDATQIVAAACADTYERGAGGLGLVWANRAPVCIPDIADLGDDERKALIPEDVVRAGLHAACALPILQAGEVLGVISFVSLEIRYPDPELLNILTAVGNQFGQFMERKRAEEALREREARFRRLFDSNIIGAFTWRLVGESDADRDVVFVDVNDAFARVVGYDRAELVSGSVSIIRLTPAEWWDLSRQRMAATMTKGIIEPIEKEYLRKDGSRVPVVIGIARFEETEDEGVAFVLDLTERKRAEYLTAQVFECSPDMIYIVGKDYCYQRMNPVYRTRLRIPDGQGVGLHVADVLGTETFELFKPHFDRCFAGEEVSFADWATIKGNRRYGAWTYTPLRPNSKYVEAVLVIVRDLTEQMVAAEALREAQADLAHVNRTAAMGQLTASIAHEVNQPITAVITNAQVALRYLTAQQPDLEEVKQALKDIVDDGKRASEVIGRTRALIKKTPPRIERFDLNEAVGEVIALTRGEWIKRGVVLQTDLASDLPMVDADRIQVQQVLLNLLLNAIEAMSSIDGARELRIGTGRGLSKDVLVTVRDTGPGLDAGDVDRLFEAFYTTKPDGMGMGLAICRSIIQMHGGRLWVQANEPRGADFLFTLPLENHMAFRAGQT